MPKKPKIEHPIRKLRILIGKSQSVFATALNCSTSVIKKIEAGNNSKLNIEILASLQQIYGVNPDSVLPPSDEPFSIEGKPYTSEFYERWIKYLSWRSTGEKEALVRDMELLTAAALRTPGKFFGFVNSFHIWFAETIQRFELEPHLGTELKERDKKIKRKPNQSKADWDLFQLFVKDKGKFIQEAFEAQIYMTPLVTAFVENKKLNIPKDHFTKSKKIPKAEILKIVGSALSKHPTDASQILQEIKTNISQQNRKR